ncbi:MAG: YhbY family RNA-binding protein [Porticoccaceae bacterium]|jgi:RNA-binding protein|nr:YhbY family RNA-binding protein [Porticoccaceae bacterium]
MDKKQLRAIGHGLKPVVMVGQKGISETLLAETDRSLSDHELIKVKLASTDRDMRRQQTEEICDKCKAELIQSVGKMALIYRKNTRPNPKTSNLIRNLAD